MSVEESCDNNNNNNNSRKRLSMEDEKEITCDDKRLLKDDEDGADLGTFKKEFRYNGFKKMRDASWKDSDDKRKEHIYYIRQRCSDFMLECVEFGKKVDKLVGEDDDEVNVVTNAEDMADLLVDMRETVFMFNYLIKGEVNGLIDAVEGEEEDEGYVTPSDQPTVALNDPPKFKKYTPTSPKFICDSDEVINLD